MLLKQKPKVSTCRGIVPKGVEMAIAIHLYAGEASKDWEKDWPLGVEIITLDVRDGQNVHDPATWKYIWDLAGSGRVIGVMWPTISHCESHVGKKARSTQAWV